MERLKMNCEIKNFKEAFIKGDIVFILRRVSKDGMLRSFRLFTITRDNFYLSLMN